MGMSLSLTASEVLSLIAACKDAQVRQFEFSGLKLEFGQVALAPTPIIGGEDPVADERHRDEHEIRIKADELETLRLSDPYAYEQIIAFDKQED